MYENVIERKGAFYCYIKRLNQMANKWDPNGPWRSLIYLLVYLWYFDIDFTGSIFAKAEKALIMRIL